MFHSKKNSFFNFSKQKLLNWRDSIPHPHLQQKIINLIENRICLNRAHFHQINLNLLKDLIKTQAIGNYHLLDHHLFTTKSPLSIQRILTHDEDDYDLLQKSLEKKIPIEVMRISIRTNLGEKFYSKIENGTEKKVGTFKKIETKIHSMISKVKMQGHCISSIHIDHVHPSLEVMICDASKIFFITNGLGNSDIHMAKTISDHLHHPLVISAILPSGLKYTADF